MEAQEHKIEVYYCRSWKVWVAYFVDAKGNQVGDCEYASSKKLVIEYLKKI